MSESPTTARPDDPARAEAAAYPGTPRWVKLAAIVAVVVAVLVVVVMILSGGEHGPMRHLPSAAGIVTLGSLARLL